MTKATLRPYFLLALLAGAFYLAFHILYPLIGPLSLAVAFAVVLRPLFRRILRMMPGRRGLSAFLTVLTGVVCILIPLLLLGTQVVSQAGSLYASLSDGSGKAYFDSGIATAENTLGRFFPGALNISEGISANLDSYLRTALGWIAAHGVALFSSAALLFLYMFVFFLALFYLLRDGAMFKRSIIALSPLEDKDEETVFHNLETAVNSVVRGNLTIALIQGTVATIGFILFGVPNAVLWGTFAAIAALIPGFGTMLVVGPAILFLFLTAPLGAAIGLLAWGVGAVGLVDNILGPKLVGRGMQLHPLFVLIAVLGGLMFFGPLGIILGPLAFTLLYGLLSIYSLATKPN